jgi:hypothetical protein
MTLPSVPQLVVEIAFTSDPLTASPTWTDVSVYVRSVNGISINRGKQTEIQTTASGSLSLTLDNRDRRFDPTFTTGPYYGNLLPRKAIRIRALWNGTYYPMFRGFVEAWPQRFMFKKDASVPLSAYDALAVLAESEVRPAVVEYLDTLTGLQWFLLNAEGNQWNDVQGGTPARLASGVFATSTINNLDGDGINFDGGSTMTFQRSPSTPNTTGSYSFWIQTTAVGPSTTVWENIFTSSTSTSAGTIVGIGSDGKLYYQGNDYNPASFSTAKTLIRVNTGEPTHICIVHNSTVSIKIYVNGVDQTDTTSGYLVDAATMPVVVDIGSKGIATPTGDNFNGTIQQFSGHSVALTAAQVETLYKLGRRLLVETSSARAERILDDLGWPAGLVSLTATAQAEVGEIPSGTNTALSLLQTVADSEQGRLFVAKDGNITLQDRYWHITSTRGNTLQATFSDDGSDLVYSALGFDYSDREVANRITITGSFGLTATDEDTASQADYGLQADSVSTLLASQEEVVSMASGLIGRRSEPIIRTDAITVQPARQTSAWPTVLGLELGDRIRVELSPVGVSPQLAQTLLVERLDWSITAENWRVAITGSPVPDEDYWMLGTSVLGTDTRLAW